MSNPLWFKIFEFLSWTFLNIVQSFWWVRDCLYDSKKNINPKRRQETYTDAVASNNKEDARKIILFTDSIPRGIWMRKFNNQCTNGVAHLKSFPGETSKELAYLYPP